MTDGSKCRNCGGEDGLHHYQTNQCPVGGREARIGQRQEYKTTVFEAEIPFDPSARLASSMTIREYFASMTMQALLANATAYTSLADIADENEISATTAMSNAAVQAADALIAALNEKK